MSTALAQPAPQAQNFAAAQPLQQYLDADGKPQKPFEEWLKTKCDECENGEAKEWEELALTWLWINLFVEGKHFFVKKHRGFGYDVIPMPTSTTANVREQNKLGFYFRTLQSRWVASRTKIEAVAGDDSDESIEASKSADLWYEAIQDLVYSERFRQEESVAAAIHGSYARYFYGDKGENYGQRPITEQREIAGEDIGECLDCEYAGPASEFGAVDDTGFGGSPETVESGDGLMGSAFPAMPAGRPDRTAQAPSSEGAGGDRALVDTGAMDAISSGLAGVCPQCQSANVTISPGQAEQLEVVTGTEKYNLTDLKALSVPYSQIRHEISKSLEDSEWMRWKRRMRTESVKAKFPNLKIPPPNSRKADPGLQYEDAMRRSVATSAGGGNDRLQRNNRFYTDFTQWWFTPCMYSDYVFPTNVETVAGETIPAGTKAIDLYPDGMYVAMLEGVDAPLQVSNEDKKWHWVTAPYHLRLFTGLGIGINDAVEMQRQWNLILSLVFTQIRTAALPGWLYAKDSIKPEEARTLGQPQNSVPVAVRNFGEGTRIEQLVHQMAPGQIPSHIPWYVGQLDANMQTSMGALVNEGVPGTDSKTATGAQIFQSGAQQHNAPEFALKGDADTRSAYVLFELSKKYFVEPRYLPLNGKHGKQGGIWLSAADLKNGQVRFRAVKDSWMPNTKMDKQEAISKLLLQFGGIQGLMVAMQTMPDFVDQCAEAFGIDIQGDIFEPTVILERQRIDQLTEMAPQYAALVEQQAAMNDLAVEAAMATAETAVPVDAPPLPVDPMTGMPGPPPDPLDTVGMQMVEDLTPPVEIEEPAHMIAIKWLRELALDDEMKEADPLVRAAWKALIKAHLEAEAQVQMIMQQFAAIANPQPSPEEGSDQKGPQQGAKPQKTDQQKRTDQGRANMGGNKPNGRPRPQPAMAGA